MIVHIRRKRNSSAQPASVFDSHWKLEWQDENGKWHPIHYDNVKRSLQISSRSFRNLMNRILQGATVTVEAKYDLQEGELVVFGIYVIEEASYAK